MPQTPDPQPIKVALVLRRIPQTRLARDLGFSAHYVNQVINGHEEPSRRLRRQSAEYLGIPEVELFRSRDAVAS